MNVIEDLLNGFSSYLAREFYEKNSELRQAIDQINDGYFSPEDPGLFHDVVNSLLGDNGDQYVSIDYILIFISFLLQLYASC